VGFHGYDAYDNTLGHYSLRNWGTSWNNTGAQPHLALVAKANFLRGVMSAYGVTGKFLVNNEVGLGSFQTLHTTEYETTKSYYAAQAYATARSLGLVANIWFSLDEDWNHQALIDPGTQTPRPSYHAYSFASEKLGLAQYVGAITGFPNVRGHEFRQEGRTLWLLWSQTDSQHVVPLPSVPTAAYHVDGSSLTVSTAQVTVGHEPIYLEWAP
jgi:hypothetical protein